VAIDAPFVLPLASDQASLALAGGKGASLARMAGAGLPVPDGFHLTTAAYRRFVEVNQLERRLAEAVAAVDPDDLASLEVASSQIASLFQTAEIPADVVDAARTAYAVLGADVPVAVRSSATAEDLADLSFAGQQDTYLNVRGAEHVLDAIRRCWASLWTARAIGYRARNRIPTQGLALAVVVQRMVAADAAGILFTADPVTGRRGQVVVNAVWGLGEGAVGGSVTPDVVVVDAASRQITRQAVADKATMVVPDANGTHATPVAEERRNIPVLSVAQVHALADVGLRVQALYGQPMDVEWLIADGAIQLTQARPITTPTRKPPAEVWNDSLNGDYLWTSANLGEAVPDVMTPCSWSLIRMFMREAMSLESIEGHHLSGNIGGRFYMNLSVAASAATAFGLGKLFEKASVEAFGRLPEGLSIPPLPLSRWRVVWGTLTTVAGFLLRVRSAQRGLWASIDAAPAHAEALRLAIAAAHQRSDLQRLWSGDVEPFFRHCSLLLAAGGRVDGGGIAKVRTEVRKLASEADTNALLTGLQARGAALASLGPVLGLAELGRGEIDRETYARRWGHRSPHEFEISTPRPAEDPEWIDRQLAGLQGVDDARALLERQEHVRAEAWARLRRSYPSRADALARRIDRAAAAFAAREAARSEVIRAFWVLRDFVRKAGQMTDLGDDVFFLSIDEILAVLHADTTAVGRISDRRETYDAYRALPVYPSLIRGRFDPFAWAADPNRRADVFDAQAVVAAPSASVRGFPGAAGIVDGVARVILTPEDADALQPGEILVTTVTNVGWTPLFPRAAAIVTDVGAPLSHAAIVARELGIPAVVGTGNATARIRTGDRLRVDGERGTVEILY